MAENHDLRHSIEPINSLQNRVNNIVLPAHRVALCRGKKLGPRDPVINEFRQLAATLLVLLLAGCAAEPPTVDSTADEVTVLPPVTARRMEIPVRTTLPVPPTPTQVQPALPAPPLVAIVLTGRQPAYDDVAFELGERLEHYEIYDLSDKSQPAETVFRLINDSDSGAVVAIGLEATQASVAMTALPVVYAQVFNYRSNGLVTERSKGVSAIAPLDAQLAAWQQTTPELRRIGAIIGEGHEDLIREAEAAADNHGVQLTIQIVRNDQEAQYQFRRMVTEIDGFWLFPDSRILSTRALRELLSQAEQRQVSVAVTNDALLSLGADISLSAVATNIAATIVEVLRRIQAGKLQDIPEITPLSAIQVVVN
ncbi:MAG TPA: ABC transporter substrate binding protein [Woeseiaceae bacterium]|nr:ABC transporter substrate binding protein [Woeseiaceae bacterium]